MSDLATVDQARARADRIRASAVAVADWLSDIRGAYASRDWEPLGYATWHDYLDGEFGAHRIALPMEERREVVAVMSRAGMSTRAIAPALGVSVGTVHADRVSTVQNRTDESTDAAPTTDQPRTVHSLDGRSRPAVQPRPRQEPVTDSAPAVRNPAVPAAVPSNADLDDQLEQRMAETAARFRTLFTAAAAKSDDVMQFDGARIVDVVDPEFLQIFIGSWRRWCDDIEHRMKPGLRIVDGTRG